VSVINLRLFCLWRLALKRHLSVVACGDRLNETVIMLKSAVLFSQEPFHVHIFTDDELHPQFQQRVRLWHCFHTYFLQVSLIHFADYQLHFRSGCSVHHIMWNVKFTSWARLISNIVIMCVCGSYKFAVISLTKCASVIAHVSAQRSYFAFFMLFCLSAALLKNLWINIREIFGKR